LKLLYKDFTKYYSMYIKFRLSNERIFPLVLPINGAGGPHVVLAFARTSSGFPSRLMIAV
jgi:hypothetical protein